MALYTSKSLEFRRFGKLLVGIFGASCGIENAQGFVGVGLV